MYSEFGITWSSIEKDIDYKYVIWSTDKNGIHVCSFFDDNFNKINIDGVLQ